jgi:hypothetical protein
MVLHDQQFIGLIGRCQELEKPIKAAWTITVEEYHNRRCLGGVRRRTNRNVRLKKSHSHVTSAPKNVILFRQFPLLLSLSLQLPPSYVVSACVRAYRASVFTSFDRTTSLAITADTHHVPLTTGNDHDRVRDTTTDDKRTSCAIRYDAKCCGCR